MVTLGRLYVKIKIIYLDYCSKKREVPFGDAVIQTQETSIASEMCEELWSPLS